MSTIESPETKDERLKTPITKVYSRRKKPEISSHDLSIDPEIGNEIETQFFDSHEDLELPIAIRKGVRTCTRHPISQFVSFQHLSPQYQAFVTQMSSHEVPNSVQEAIKLKPWREAVNEEMRALEKNQT